VDEFRTLTEPRVDSARARRIENMVAALDELTDSNELIELLAPPVNPIVAVREVPA
jgi:hypothetical protein